MGPMPTNTRSLPRPIMIDSVNNNLTCNMPSVNSVCPMGYKRDGACCVPYPSRPNAQSNMPKANAISGFLSR
jgi:hypothetical protein